MTRPASSSDETCSALCGADRQQTMNVTVRSLFRGTVAATETDSAGMSA